MRRGGRAPALAAGGVDNHHHAGRHGRAGPAGGPADAGGQGLGVLGAVALVSVSKQCVAIGIRSGMGASGACVQCSLLCYARRLGCGPAEASNLMRVHTAYKYLSDLTSLKNTLRWPLGAATQRHTRTAEPPSGSTVAPITSCSGKACVR